MRPKTVSSSNEPSSERSLTGKSSHLSYIPVATKAPTVSLRLGLYLPKGKYQEQQYDALVRLGGV